MTEKTARVPILMPRKLLDATDDRRFAHRLASRAEAIHRLIEIGLAHQDEIPPLDPFRAAPRP